MNQARQLINFKLTGLLIAGCVIGWLCAGPASHVAPSLMACQFTAIFVVFLGYALVRVNLHNPLGDTKYAQWLASTPWQPGQALPLGPMRIVAVDVAVVLTAGLLATLTIWFMPPVEAPPDTPRERFISDPLKAITAWTFMLGPLSRLAATLVFMTLLATACFLGVYVSASILWIGAAPWHRRLALAFLPFVAFPRCDLFQIVAVLVATALVVDRGQRAALRGLPYRTVGMHPPAKQREIDLAEAARITAGAFGGVGPGNDRDDQNLIALIVNRLLLSLWAVVLANLFFQDLGGVRFVGSCLVEGLSIGEDAAAPVLTWWAIGFCTTCARFFRYRYGHRPPLTLRLRVRTLRLISPRWDQVYLVPLFLVGFTFYGPAALFRAGVPRGWIPGVSLGVLLLAGRLGPPFMTRWKHTGHHRVYTPRST